MTHDDSARAEGEHTQIREVLERAINDPTYRRLLLDDLDAAISGYQLSEIQVLLLASLVEEDLEKLTPENLDEYFAVDSAIYTPDDMGAIRLSEEEQESTEVPS